jgi:DNA-binding transcriptional ArsR family regulator
MATMRFLSNHAFVLIHVANHPKSTLREIALAVGITERAVQTVLKDLEREGLIKARKEGRKKRYWVNFPRLLSYRLEGPYPTVGELAQAITDLGNALRHGDIPMDFPDDDDDSDGSADQDEDDGDDDPPDEGDDDPPAAAPVPRRR